MHAPILTTFTAVDSILGIDGTHEGTTIQSKIHNSGYYSKMAEIRTMQTSGAASAHTKDTVGTHWTHRSPSKSFENTSVESVRP